MSAKKAWLLFTVLRIVFFAVPFTVIMLLLPADLRVGLNWGVVFAVLTSAVIALSLSVLFLSKLREQAAAAVANWRASAHNDEAAAEDALIAEAAVTAAESSVEANSEQNGVN